MLVMNRQGRNMTRSWLLKHIHTPACKNRGKLQHWSHPGSKGHVRSLGTCVTAAIWCQHSVRCTFDSTWCHTATNAVVRFRDAASRILRKWVLNIRTVSYQRVQLNSEVQHTVTWTATEWLPHRLCYRPAIFVRYLLLIAFPLPQWNIRRAFQICYFFQIYLYF